MSQNEQVQKALKLLRPANRAECTKYLQEALNDLAVTKAENQHLRDISSKEARKALNTYRRSLRRAQIARDNLTAGLKATFAALARSRGETEPNFDAFLDGCDRILGAPHSRSNKDHFKYNAAAWAWNILNLLEMETPLTHNGKWTKLAAILHGEADSDDLFHHCSQYSASKNGGQK